MKNLILILSLTLVGCAELVKEDQGPSEQTIDPTFSPYLERIESEFRKVGKPLQIRSSIVFGQMRNASSEAECHTYPKINQIVVRADVWQSLSEEQRLFLLAHEIGHCELGRAHEDSMVEISYSMSPKSIMHFSGPRMVATTVSYHPEKIGYYFQELAGVSQ